MAVNQAVIEELGFAKGQPPMTGGQFRKRVEAFQRKEWHPLMREKDPDGYGAWLLSMQPTVAEAESNFVFNWQLQAYRQAVARIARYRLADGQAEVTEQQETGEYDAQGQPIMESVVVSPAVDPLPAQIEEVTYDDDGQVSGVEMAPNPLIVADDAERAAAQAVVDATPQAVRDFVEAEAGEY